jgi:hypothetical protein
LRDDLARAHSEQPFDDGSRALVRVPVPAVRGKRHPGDRRGGQGERRLVPADERAVVAPEREPVEPALVGAPAARGEPREMVVQRAFVGGRRAGHVAVERLVGERTVRDRRMVGRERLEDQSRGRKRRRHSSCNSSTQAISQL